MDFQGEGPTWEKKRRTMASGKAKQQARSVQQQHALITTQQNPGKHVAQKLEKRAWELFGAKPDETDAVQDGAELEGSAKKRRKKAAWKQNLPQKQQDIKGLSLPAVFDKFGWGNSRRELLPIRKGKEVQQVPTGEGFRGCVDKMVHDLVLCARAEGTWKAYAGWVGVFQAFLGKFGVPLRPEVELWEKWVEVLLVTVAVLSQSYSLGTISVLISAVSVYMQDYGLRSPYESRILAMVLKGLPRHMGM
jgi:hypothetical protein